MSVAPENPQSLPQMTWFLEPDTNNIFAYAGIDLGWLEFSTGGHVGPANGLKLFGSNIGLGGTLSENTVIQGLGGVGLGMNMYNSSTGATNAGIFGVDENGSQIAASNYSTQEDYTVLVSEPNHQAAIQYRKVVGGAPKNSSISIGQTGMIVTDDNFSTGLKYKIDYSAAGILDDRWIPDYGAIKGLTNVTGSNGIQVDPTTKNITIGGYVESGFSLIGLRLDPSSPAFGGQSMSLFTLAAGKPGVSDLTSDENESLMEVTKDGTNLKNAIRNNNGKGMESDILTDPQNITIFQQIGGIEAPRSLNFPIADDATLGNILLTDPTGRGVTVSWSDDSNLLSSSYVPKRYVEALNGNNIHSIGYSNQVINDGLQIHDTNSPFYTFSLDGRGIRNSDYQITTNGANAFFNSFLRNGISVVGISGNTIASFNDANVGADNPNINFNFPLIGTKASFSSAPVNPTDVVRLQDIGNINSSYVSATTAVSGINVFGTSYEGPGFGASNPATLSWIPLIKPSTGWTINNQGFSGNFVCDQTFLIYNTPINSKTFTIEDLGINDMNFYYTDATKQAIFADEHLAILAYLAIPNSKKVLANSSAVTYAGTWTAGKYAISKQTSGNGNTATFTISGTTVLVSTTQGDGLTGAFTIKIDGSTVGTYTNGTAASMITNNGSGINYGPSIKMFTGLSNTAHTVVITTTTTNAVFFDWAAGIDTSTPNPQVYASNLVYQNATGNPYPINNANVDTYNGFISSNISTLTGLGLNVSLVNFNSVINPSTDIGANGLHPNDAGYAKIASLMLTTIPSTFYNVGSAIQTLNSANNATAWQVIKNTNPASTSGVGIRLENDDASNASIYRAPSTSVDRTPFGLYISNNSTSNSTVLDNPIIFNNGAVEVMRLLGGNVRLPQYKTAGVITNRVNDGQLISTPILAASLGGSGVNNSVTLNYGTGGTLGSNAFTSTAYLPVASPTFTGTLSGPIGNFAGNLVSMVTAWPTTANTIFGASQSGGAGYPFNNNLNLITAPRPGFDYVWGSGSPTVVRGYISALSGNLNWGSTSGTDLAALFSVTQPTTGNGTGGNTAGGTTVTGVGTQFQNTFKIGDAITMGGETQTITAIASNTSMTTTTWTNAHTTSAYTLVGGTRLQVPGNGNVVVSGLNVANLTASLPVKTDASKNLISATIATSDIANNAVTYGKIQAMTANRLLGSGASGTAVAEITLGTGLSFTGTTLNATGLTNPMTTLGDIIYGGASGAPTRLAGNTTTARQFLTSTGSAGVATAPAFFDLFGTNNSWTNTNAFNSQTDFFSSVTFRGGTGTFFYNVANTFNNQITAPTLTGNRITTLQDKSGTIALVEDIKADNVLAKTANYTVLTSDWVAGKTNILRIFVDSTAGNVTITLPSASSLTGYSVYVTKKDASVNTVIIGTVLGSTTLVTQYQSLNYSSDASNWYSQ